MTLTALATKVNVTALSVTYVEDGVEKTVNVDTRKVHALAWTKNAIKERMADPPQGPVNVPKREDAGPVPLGETERDTGFCWFDGKDWVCN